ncbi:MAG: hypothetical protein CL581_13040 [Alteromonadaceae bacterium]|nr:hypothetical protein [Alteromonadaceae bacterium]MBH86045.1 hypothetical protein [Alteromonadaceae bacterium]|tara:strand:- start:16127 stop:17383 length:1257 start_codon:yes stop_codon:yes gene_type:complete
MVSSVSGPGSDASVLPKRTGNDAAASQRQSQTSQASDARSSQTIRTVDDAMAVLRARLEQRLEQRMGGTDAASGAGKPSSAGYSAEDVANNVLGFVQNRLQKEAAAGADPDRLASLLEQARAGVEQGFAEAREQIEALGMMNDELGAGIDDSFDRITEGLDKLEKLFLGNDDAAVANNGAEKPSQAVDGAQRTTSASSVEAASRDQLSFEVTTSDGDRITVRMDELRYASASQVSGSDGTGRFSSASSTSMFSGRYAFSVEGDLDAGEREALNNLFKDVEAVSAQFFEGDVMGAFEAAKSLDLGGEELAAFSLNLSSVRSVRAAAYESVSQSDSGRISSPATQLKPLGSLAQGLQELADKAQQNGLDLTSLNDLMTRMLEDGREQASRPVAEDTASLMGDFWQTIFDTMKPADTDSAQ